MNEGSSLPLSRKQRFWNRDREPAPLGSERSDNCPRRRKASSFLWFLEAKPWGSHQRVPTPSLWEQEPWSPWYPRPCTQMGSQHLGTELGWINKELGLEEPSIARLADSVCPCPRVSGQAESVQAERDPVNTASHRLDTDEDEPSEGWEKKLTGRDASLWRQLCYPCLKPCQDIPELETK